MGKTHALKNAVSFLAFFTLCRVIFIFFFDLSLTSLDRCLPFLSKFLLPHDALLYCQCIFTRNLHFSLCQMLPSLTDTYTKPLPYLLVMSWVFTSLARNGYQCSFIHLPSFNLLNSHAFTFTLHFPEPLMLHFAGLENSQSILYSLMALKGKV